MIRRPDERTGLAQRGCEGLEIAEGVDLPRQVIQPNGATPGLRWARVGANLEQPEVVIVGRSGGTEKRRSGYPGVLGDRG